MKTKKLIGLVLGFTLMSTLSSCGENVEEINKALDKAVQMSVLADTNGTPFDTSVAPTLTGDDYLALKATTKQIVSVSKAKYTVDFEWSWDSKYNAYLNLYDLPKDETHQKIAIDYPEKGSENVELEIKAKAKCGSQSRDLLFKATITATTLTFDEMSIAELYAVNSTKDNFAFIGSDGKIVSNHDNQYYQIAVSGKVIYKAPDSNWGLLADGDKVVQLYQLGKCADDDIVEVGAYIKAYASIAQYYGNIQLSYVKKVRLLEDHSKIAEPKDIVVTDDIGESPITATSKYSWFSGLGNAITTVTGTLDSDVSGFKPTARFTFNIKLANGKLLEVAHDYHTASNGSAEADAVKDAFVSVLGSAVKGTTKLTIHGTVRYSGDGVAAGGKWTIVPFLATDIKAA